MNEILRYVPGRFKREASTHGGEWSGPCPWCYGTDRFRVWPYREAHELVYWCRGCGACGDLIQFLRDALGMSFQQAVATSGQAPWGRAHAKGPDLLNVRRTHVALEPQQLSLLNTLEIIEHRMQAAIMHPRARAYLAFRAIPLSVATGEGVGYLPPSTAETRAIYHKNGLHLWEDSFVTPTPSPWGKSYTARSLRLWIPGMDEEEQKHLLKELGSPRILKTGRAGWLWHPQEVRRAVIMVEGVFEKLALLAAGFAACDVIAVGSNAANIDWLPVQVAAVLVAFNADDRGRAGASRLVAELRCAGITAMSVSPPDDSQGSDCSARWRLAGQAGVDYLCSAWKRFQLSAQDPLVVTSNGTLGAE
jgi:CHC2 zinc finger